MKTFIFQRLCNLVVHSINSTDKYKLRKTEIAFKICYFSLYIYISMIIILFFSFARVPLHFLSITHRRRDVSAQPLPATKQLNSLNLSKLIWRKKQKEREKFPCLAVDIVCNLVCTSITYHHIPSLTSVDVISTD